MKNIKYTALFVNNPEKLLALFIPKHVKVYGHHSTIEYRPKNIENLEFGKKCLLKIIGRATDEKGDALFVVNPKSENEFAHITLSCREDTKPIYSNILLEKAYIDATLEIFDEPVYIAVTEGYCDTTNNVHQGL